MASSNPGRRKVREYVPPHLSEAMLVTRLANAEWAADSSHSQMRYVIVCNVHEGIDPEQPLWILDSLVAEQNRQSRLKGENPDTDTDYVLVAELLSRLSENSRKRVLYS